VVDSGEYYFGTGCLLDSHGAEFLTPGFLIDKEARVNHL
jgi:hypothetical protein